jgi:dihydroneopterin aldolase
MSLGAATFSPVRPFFDRPRPYSLRNWRDEVPEKVTIICLAAFASPRRGFLPNLDCVEDKIHIEQLEVSARIGVPDGERAAPQRLTFTLTLWPGDNFGQLNDQLARTVDYSAVCKETKSFVEQRSDKLIETLADALALRLLDRFEIRRITVELRKYILPEVEFVSVTVTRDRPEK